MGAKKPDLCRRHEVGSHTFYRWRGRDGGPEPSKVKRLRPLEDENRPLKGLVADLTLDEQALELMLSNES